MKWYSANFIAGIMGITAKAVRKRAINDNWEYRSIKNRKEYDFDSLPEDVKIKIAERKKESAKPPSKDIKSLNQRNLKYGELRAYLLSIFQNNYNLSVDEFCYLYNNNKISIPNLIKEKYQTISPATFYRWLNASPDGDITELSTNYYKSKKGAGSRTLTEDQIIVITGLYLKFKAFKMKKTFRYFIEHFGEINASYTTIRRVLNSIPPAVKDLYKKGRRFFNDKYAPFVERNPEFYNVMQLWDSDHHRLDCFVIDENGKAYRPWLTAFQDMRSRKIVGWNIGKTASSWTIALAFKMAITKYGAPNELLIDNGKDFKGKQLQGYTVKFSDEQQLRVEGLFEKFGVKCTFATPYHGQAKPIESFFRTLIEDFTVELPTYTGSNTVSTIKERDLVWKEVLGNVKLTLNELIDRFEKWVTKWNATWEHTGAGMYGRSPDTVFNEGMKNYIKLDIPEDHLQYMFARDYYATVGRNGILIEGTRYYDSQLFKYKGKGTDGKALKIIAKRDIYDIGKISVYDLDGNYICEAYHDYFKDLGITEENIKNVKKAKKEERDIAKEFEERILLSDNKSFEEKVIIDASKDKKRVRVKSEPLSREKKSKKSLFI